MNKIGIASPATLSSEANNDKEKQLSWIDNPSVQKLLDIISSILADEYIQIAKQNQEIFKIRGSK